MLLLALRPSLAWADGRRAELLVFGAGEDVFERYGHAGLRILGPAAADDRIFNFGITDWTKPNYIQDFLTGRVAFWGNVRPWARTRNSYVKWDRTILRYPLDLTPAEVDALVVRLEHDVLPENRNYIYDTFRNNCATRLRDYIDDVTGGAVRRSLAEEPLGPSYREDVRVAFAAFPSLLILTEIVPGLPLDAHRSTWERMYRPAVLGEAITHVHVTRDGVSRPLTTGPIVDRLREGPEPLTGWPDLGQAILGGLAFALAGLALAIRSARPRRRVAAALLWLVPASLMALLLVTVAVGTVWPDMQENWLVLALPVTDLALYVPLIGLLRGRPVRHLRLWRGYLTFRAVTVLLLAGLGPVWGLLAGPLPPRVLCAAGLLLLAAALFGPSPPAAVQPAAVPPAAVPPEVPTHDV